MQNACRKDCGGLSKRLRKAIFTWTFNMVSIKQPGAIVKAQSTADPAAGGCAFCLRKSNVLTLNGARDTMSLGKLNTFVPERMQRDNLI